ncbi:hypothetical protein H5T51_08795, partial [Candidatus Bathyarchaeota archaeon]|nr:hypothetical protein [Candidatus Bathyarchaeota archaeon]
LLKKAVNLHGHLGPFLVLGLKMSLIAEERLGGKPRKCLVKTVKRKPYLCAVDGVKAALGELPIEVLDGEGLTMEFTGVDGEKTEIKVKKKIVEKCAQVPWEKCEEYAYEVLKSNDSKLFE